MAHVLQLLLGHIDRALEEPPAPLEADRVGEGALDGRGRAAEVFRDIARRIVDDVAPPANMSGCSARMLGLVEQALAAKDASATQSSES